MVTRTKEDKDRAVNALRSNILPSTIINTLVTSRTNSGACWIKVFIVENGQILDMTRNYSIACGLRLKAIDTWLILVDYPEDIVSWTALICKIDRSAVIHNRL